MYHSGMWSNCGSDWLIRGLNSSRAMWTSRLNSLITDSVVVFAQTKVTSNTFCNIIVIIIIIICEFIKCTMSSQS